MVKIDPDRLLTDLKRLRGFGATGPGVVRRLTVIQRLEAQAGVHRDIRRFPVHRVPGGRAGRRPDIPGHGRG